MSANSSPREAARLPAKSHFATSLSAVVSVFQSLAPLENDLAQAADWCCGALKSGNKILTCGNGGSACEALHLTGELMGRYKRDRPGLSAIALPADPVLLTCIGNDFRFEDVFARQIEALCNPQDVVVVFTTSGNSPNILKALDATRRSGARSVAFLGGQGGAARALADCSLLVPETDTPHIQEAHQFLLHALMDAVEQELANT
jgi:D-sedoheptulose 7-phosphate isomerase